MNISRGRVYVLDSIRRRPHSALVIVEARVFSSNVTGDKQYHAPTMAHDSPGEV